jgi:hypothetical protein
MVAIIVTEQIKLSDAEKLASHNVCYNSLYTKGIAKYIIPCKRANVYTSTNNISSHYSTK